MKSRVCCLLLLGMSLIGPSLGEDNPAAGKLNSTLLELKRSGPSGKTSLRQQLVDEIVSLTENDRRPSRSSVAVFADEFIGALIGRDLNSAQLTVLERSILEVTRSSGTTFDPATSLRETLTAIGVGASKVQAIIKRFIAIGEEIRGPDDQPL